MRHILLFIILTLSLVGCKDPATTIPFAEAKCIDSFEVHGFEIGQQVQSLVYVDDTTMYSYIFTNGNLVKFKRKPGSKIYNVGEKEKISTEFLSTIVRGDDNKLYAIHRNNSVTAYDFSGNKVLYTKPIVHSFEYLKDSFELMSSNLSPAIVNGDTLVAAFVHNDLGAYANQFKENGIAEFSLTGDSIRYIRSYIPRPKNTIHQYYPFQLYCVSGKNINVVYPGTDTIYSFNRTTGQLKKYPINNPDYKTPGFWDYRKMRDAAYNSKWVNSNFAYQSFRYDSDKNEYLLFYVEEVPKNKNGNPEREGRMFVLVLDSDFKIKRKSYLPVGIKHVIPRSYFHIPGKGLAIPIFKGFDDFENTTYYIYSF